MATSLVTYNSNTGSSLNQQNLQKVQDYAQSKSFNSGHDEGYRWSDNMCDAFDKLSSSQESYQKAKNNLEQVSENTSWFEQNSQMIKSSLNQDFIKWSSSEQACSGGFDRVKEILSEDSPQEIQPLIQKFIHHTREKTGLPQSINDVSYRIQGFESDFESTKHKVTEEYQNRENSVLSTIEKFPSRNTYNDLYKEGLSQRFSDIKQNQETGTEILKEKLDTHRESASDDFEFANSKYLLERLWQGPNKSENLGDNCRIVEAPFWHNTEEQ